MGCGSASDFEGQRVLWRGLQAAIRLSILAYVYTYGARQDIEHDGENSAVDVPVTTAQGFYVR